MTDLGADQGEHGQIGEDGLPWSRWQVLVAANGADLLGQILALAGLDEGMGGGVAVAQEDLRMNIRLVRFKFIRKVSPLYTYKDHEPDDTEAAKEVEHKWPVVGIEEHSRQQVAHNGAHLTAAQHQSTELAALICRNPGRKEYTQGREGGALAETHQDTSHNQPVRATLLDGQRRQHGEDGGGQDANAQGPLAAKFLGQQTAGDVGDNVTDVEGGQDQALQLLGPVVVAAFL